MKYPWIAWYPAEYISKTRSLTMKQHGAYCLLLWEYYTNGPLVANAKELLSICCAHTEEDREDVLSVLRKFFVMGDGFWHHKRADEEMHKRASIRKNLQLSGKKGGLAKAKRLLEQNAGESLACLQSQSHKTLEPKKGGDLYSSEENPSPPVKTNGKYTQTDFDERDIRKLAAAEADMFQRARAAIGSDQQVTEEELFTMACEVAGITVERGLKLRQMQRNWPKKKSTEGIYESP